MRSRSGTLARSILVCGGISLAGLSGYWLGILTERSASVFPVQRRFPIDFYVTKQSFSEIENTKAELDGLATQYLIELRTRHDASVLGKPASARSGNPAYAVGRPQAIEEIQAGIKEFKGTDQEMVLVNELLVLLKKEDLNERWLDVYLRLLYEHPTYELVRNGLNDAIRISGALGRQEDLARALDFLTRIPFEFPAKEKAVAGLSGLHVAEASTPGATVPWWRGLHE